MTLFKQIIIVLSILQTIIFGAVMWFNFNSSREYVKEQAYTDALHTANSLGLSISSTATFDDVSMSETMINSVFDSGYYEKIVLEDMSQNKLVEKEQKVVLPDVPAWFVNYVKLEPPVATSQIMLGWTPYGILHVQLNSGHAYRQLWTIFKEVLFSFVAISFLGVLILHVVLRIILKPLVRVKEQAEAILESDFLLQKDIPFTTELRNVVFAMNSMVKKVKEIFEKEIDAVRKYHEALYHDSVTKMYNRRYFNIKLQEYLGSEEKTAQGVLILTSINDFESLKKSLGYEQNEALLREMATFMTNLIHQNPEYVCARLSDTDFAILAPNTDEEAFTKLGDELTMAFRHIFKVFELDENIHFVNTGYAKYYAGFNAKELFSKADFALTSSKAKGPFGIECFKEESEKFIVLGKEAWAHELAHAMEENRFKLAFQNVVNIDDYSDIFHSELFLRLQEKNGYVHNAGYFMPMATELKMGFQMDHFVIQKTIELLTTKELTCKSVCINLGKEILLQSNDWIWLEESIENFKKAGKQTLYFEVQSAHIPTDILVKFSKYLRSHGYGLGLDNFAINSESLVSMQYIIPAYIKINASRLIDLLCEHGLETPSRSFGILTSSMDIKVIASNVEDAKQNEILKELGVHYLQGSFISAPKLLG